MWLIAIVLVVLLLGYAATKYDEKKVGQANQQLEGQGLKLSDFKRYDKCTYAGGHPDGNDNFEYVAVLPREESVRFYSMPVANEIPRFMFEIKKDAIQGIELEDATTMENRVTLGRVFLVGVFALAWRKKKKNELAFVVVEWNDGRFGHATTFSFEGKDALQKANRFRNDLVAACR